MKHSIFGLCSVTALASLLACGGISDPSRSGENVAVVQGALTSSDSVSVPANAHVAIVWYDASGGKLAIGADAPVVDGKFSFKLTAPADAYFVAVDGEGSSDDTAPPSDSDTAPAPAPASGDETSGSAGSATPKSIRPLADNVGGSITDGLRAAIGGFVVYADDNGNGKLDLDDDQGTFQSSPDKIVGGSTDLALVYLKGGGTVDYEKLRDKTGVKPAAGFNLHVDSNDGLWLSANDVSLKIGPKRLPSSVCSNVGDVLEDGPTPATPTNPTGNSSSGANGSNEPAIDPNIICAPDGRSYVIQYGNCDQPTTPTPEGLCTYSTVSDTCSNGAAPGGSLEPGEPVPAGWPCPISGGDEDAGPPNTDPSQPDSGSDAPPPPPDAG